MANDSQIEDTTKKSHRDRKSGRKADKKKQKKNAQGAVEEQTDKQRNPKAFAFNSAVRAERRFRRKQDIETKKQHVPLVDRTPLEPPPVLVAVVGPPKVGKTTLINSLIWRFNDMPKVEIKGPITLVISKKRRLTFIECNNDISSMIDLAKVADLVLLLCDASFGFEMEVFEFLNICDAHGMPRVMGVLTHLDMIKNCKTQKNTKKVLKHRFWKEVHPGAKLFYLTDIKKPREDPKKSCYPKTQIENLGRFISVMKMRPLTWRTTHGYLLGDRYEDLTSQDEINQNAKCNRNISLYGYLRGVPIKSNSSVHIAGLGDMKIHAMSYLPDPCPMPDQAKKRGLIKQERLLYGYFSGMGGIVYDKDAVYMDLGGSHNHKQEDDDGEEMVANLIQAQAASNMHNKDADDTDDEGCEDEGDDELVAEMSEDDEDAGEISDDSDDEEDQEQDAQPAPEKKSDDFAASLNNYKGKFSQYKEEWVEDSGRERRRVVFDLDDEEMLRNLNAPDKEEDDSKQEKEKSLKRGLKENRVSKSTKNAKQNQASDDSEAEDERMLTNNDESDASSNETYSEDEEQDAQPAPDKNSDYFVASLKNYKGKFSDYKEERVENSGRQRRRVVFDLDDNEILRNLNASDQEEDDSQQEKKKSSKRGLKENRVSKSTKNAKQNQASDDSDEEDEQMVIDNDESDASSNDTGSDDEADEDHNETEDDDGDENAWKDGLAAWDGFAERQDRRTNWMKLVYDVKETETPKDEANSDAEDSDDDVLREVSRSQQKLKSDKDIMHLTDSTLLAPWDTPCTDYMNPNNKMLIMNCFMTGTWKKSEDAEELLRLDDAEDLSDADSQIFGDFEDLETGVKHSASNALKRPRTEDEKDEKADREALAEKKRKLKEKFDNEYDETEKTNYYDDLKETAKKQELLNRTVFDNMPDNVRVQIEGFRPGMYVRMEFRDVPVEFVQNFDPSYPLVVGALNVNEENVGYVDVKIKKHRWYSRTLKSFDPLIISMGWRRFQTTPIYSMMQDDLRFRYLKYTPQHLSCNAHFWGPITPQGTGFVALQSLSSKSEIIKQRGFRIAATGSVQELDKSTKVTKKLKLIGYPMKIYNKTAFIKGMFSSALEVARFEGARIKTASGIRGQIKKAVSKPEGCFRATFEDKILLSDIVFCRTWYNVDVTRFYNVVTTLLLPPDRRDTWRGLRTVGEIKREKGIRNPVNPDSLYTPVERQPRPLKPLIIPSKLQRALPYRDKPKHQRKQNDKNANKDRVAVIKEPYEQKVSKVMKMIKTMYEHKQQKMKMETQKRLEEHRRTIEAQEQQKNKKLKEKKKAVFRTKSKAQNKNNK